ncbi:hypothetical protein Goshw_007676, partial [Gossypium schwendimanii]|nr:hypothetical protein [Gossypium schwendimanii]
QKTGVTGYCTLTGRFSHQLFGYLFELGKSIVRREVRSLNERMVPLEAIVPAAQNNINTQFILLEKGKITWDGQNKMCLGLVADKTAAVHLQLWGEECEAFEAGDIIRMENGIFSYNKNNLVLRAGRRGKVEKVGDFTMEFVETPNLSEVKWVPDPNNSN